MIYDKYAGVYDETGQLHFSILTANYLPDLVRAHPIAGRELLDLACGTGTFAIMQAEAGWDVTGVDQSPAMLSVARRKAAIVNIELAWIESDLRSLVLEPHFDIATCWYDSINYLVEEADVHAAFANVWTALRPGGLFCFDVATLHFLHTYWHGVELSEAPGYVQVMQSAFESNGRSTLIVSGFQERTPGRWQHFREVHVERGYPANFWEQALVEVGFVVEGCYECFTLQPPHERSLRLCWVARKPGNELSLAGIKD